VARLALAGSQVRRLMRRLAGLAWRMSARDWRAGELRFLLLALVVAVAALTSVGFFVERMKSGLARDANQLLGADLLVRADKPLPPAWKDEAVRQSLSLAETVVFPSMAGAGQGDSAQSMLASVKAVSEAYPLRGQVTLKAGTGSRPARGAPAAGTVWADATLLNALKLRSGDMLRLGDRQFKVAEVIDIEPDRGAAFMNFAPRVMLSLGDLASTGLVQEGSRVVYRLLVAGPPAQVKTYQAWLSQRIEKEGTRGVGLESLEAGRPEMRATIERAEQFLSLVGLLSAMLAAVAIAMAARRFMLRHVDAFAMLRCLGLSQSRVMLLFLFEFVLVGFAASLVGTLIGFAAHYVLLEWLGRLVTTTLPPASLLPGLQGIGAGMLLLLGFALPPLLQLRDVPHNHVIRREARAPRVATLATYALGLASFVALLLWQAGNLKLSALTAGGFLVGLLVFAVVGWLGLQAVGGARNFARNPSWHFAVTALSRRPGATVVQVVALALGLMALLLLTVIRADLVAAWRTATPPDAPDHFVINIQPDQRQAVQARLTQAGVKSPLLYPMIRGRLVKLNGQDISASTYSEDRARRLVEREFNLSTMADLPAGNEVVAGNWRMDRPPEASVEVGLAKTLGLKLGDVLSFDIAGSMVEAPVTSLRKLEWGSMRVNFFVILNPALMADTPQTFITAFHAGPNGAQLGNALSREFPNLTVVDVGSVLRQVQAVIDQVVSAVEFLFLFTLCSGVLVLYAALAGSQDQRVREAALLRALGATRSQLSRAQWMEFAMVGTLAGLLAALGASAVGWTLAEFLFDFEWLFKPGVWLAGLAAGVACALIGGWAGLRGVLKHPPLQSLRQA
jgi:putative ABC transport system permease protein